MMPKIICEDGCHLFYSVTGSGEPLVLIAGGFCDHRVWDDVIDILNTQFQVIVYDHRGIGESDFTQNNYTVSLLASDLNCLLTQLNISSVHIVGHSMGGFIAQYFAAFYPDKVLSLSLLSSLLTMNQIGRSYLDNIMDSLKHNPDALRQSMPEKSGHLQETDSVLQQISLCKKHDAQSYINKINVPTLIVSGHKEPVVTEIETKRLASAIKNVREVIFLDCGHMLQRAMPNELVTVIFKFIKNLVA
jgi:pimeloyl-ACP methyl ester carboxylesterase